MMMKGDRTVPFCAYWHRIHDTWGLRNIRQGLCIILYTGSGYHPAWCVNGRMIRVEAVAPFGTMIVISPERPFMDKHKLSNLLVVIAALLVVAFFATAVRLPAAFEDGGKSPKSRSCCCSFRSGEGQKTERSKECAKSVKR
jgi:hypothetical protein